MNGNIKITSDFPGGNITVESVSGNTVRVHQDLRDTGSAWFYWYFAVDGAAGRTIRFEFTASRALGTRGPAVSYDTGRTWRWLGDGAVDGNTFSFTFPADAGQVRFSMGMPYQLADWERFIAGLPAGSPFSIHTLCTSNGGRAVPYALLGPDSPTHRVAITARHHCCEMMAGYGIEGLITRLVSAAEPAAEQLCAGTQFIIIPFMDLDGVEQGDQGKGRSPRDHGRDYKGESIYPETAAVRELLPRLLNGVPFTALDLHCPWIAGRHHECIHLVGSPTPAIAAAQQRFSGLLEQTATGPLPCPAANLLPFGTDWNTAANSADGLPFSRWAETLSGSTLAAAIELPYANADGVAVTADTARRFGADLGRALARFINS